MTRKSPSGKAGGHLQFGDILVPNLLVSFFYCYWDLRLIFSANLRFLSYAPRDSRSLLSLVPVASGRVRRAVARGESQRAAPRADAADFWRLHHCQEGSVRRQLSISVTWHHPPDFHDDYPLHRAGQPAHDRNYGRPLRGLRRGPGEAIVWLPAETPDEPQKIRSTRLPSTTRRLIRRG